MNNVPPNPVLIFNFVFVIRSQANPNNLVSQTMSDDDSSSDSEDDNETSKPSKASRKKSKDSSKSGVYVPPKLSAVHYDADDTKGERQRKQLERAKKRAFRLVAIKIV